MLKAPTIKKGDLTEVLKALSMAHQELASNLPYVVERAMETISEAVDKGKAEINAHQSFITAQAGQMALAVKLHADEAARLSDTSGVATKG